MQFKKLRLHGFKSFVDQTEVLIEEGLTGVVGPNGCGKSNVIESLRWVMGETSAKRMRGKEMDDVIFGGSGNRPPRNIAEVTLTLDNKDRNAPSAFNDTDELEITRRIERGKGSGYRINGREVRARDVQLLFADLASGANSTAIVSQGRIGALIGAKPAERRTLLEEAAGIRGLHSRRHEAELRLKAAESNLERLEDVIAALDVQNQGLQKQARQANRYRRLSEQIRRFDAILLHLRWTSNEEQLVQARAALAEVEEIVHEKTQLAASGASSQAKAAEKLPELRKKEAEAAAELQRLQLAERELTNEESRLQQSRMDLENRLRQLTLDMERERALEGDARQALERLASEKEMLDDGSSDQLEMVEELKEAMEVAQEEVSEKEVLLNQLTEQVAGLEAQRNALMQQGEQAASRIERLKERASELAIEKENLAQDMELVEELDLAEETVMEAETTVEAMREALEVAEESLQHSVATEREARDRLQSEEVEGRKRIDATEAENRHALQETEKTWRDKLNKAESKLQNLKAEYEALGKILAASLTDIAEPLAEHITVEAGYEMALGSALGDELDASIQAGEPISWQEVPGAESFNLPSDMKSLLDFVKAPKALSRRLSQVAVADNADAAAKMQSQLKQGQRIVTKEGGLWRWDGYTIVPDVPSSAAQKLEQKKRLEELEGLVKDARVEAEEMVEQSYIQKNHLEAECEAKLEQMRMLNEETLEAVQTSFADAVEASSAAEEATRLARENQQAAYGRLNESRQHHTQLASRAAAAKSRLMNVEDNAKRVADEIEEAEILLASSQSQLDELEDASTAWDRVNQLRANLAELRSIAIQKQSSYDNLHREAEVKMNRLRAIATEEQSWQERMSGTSSRMEELQMRAEQAEEEKMLLEARPEEIAEQRVALLDKINFSEAKRNVAADELAEAEKYQYDADRALKDAEQALAEVRETRVRLQAGVEQAQLASDNVAERIMEKLECYPKDVLATGGVGEDEELPLRPEVETRLERLTRERENMGAVNLRAEQEAAELQTRIDEMNVEHEDLIEAIAKLRQGISALNREGRERLLAAFEEVNGHFKELFVRLFGGGEAELKLTEADDPLQAGLEIMASPPGKRMQIMSLLSGGEQALTALSLLFAVFLTNPAPICVLDEVDAPLDDANVDRFCKMLEEMSNAGTTRFLVVTHHRMTMARVDRLFGVTMAERGVSQLVSVDLRRAAQMRETG
ncbi:coiled-coil domain-containing protein [Curvivirga aplysinae]|uniref:AAA family ATPase n=1 Tax=Curvivirga aplysinae TaxID=2529852 RepID=UPI0012BBF800|nr:AAA family ATPase [Curvivirga aplysinae]MTI08878.1 chromosome partitioning protein ParA [Curvivirga aplysinae]